METEGRVREDAAGLAMLVEWKQREGTRYGGAVPGDPSRKDDACKGHGTCC